MIFYGVVTATESVVVAGPAGGEVGPVTGGFAGGFIGGFTTVVSGVVLALPPLTGGVELAIGGVLVEVVVGPEAVPVELVTVVPGAPGVTFCCTGSGVGTTWFIVVDIGFVA